MSLLAATTPRCPSFANLIQISCFADVNPRGFNFFFVIFTVIGTAQQPFQHITFQYRVLSVNRLKATCRQNLVR